MQEGDSAARKVYRLAGFCAALAALSIIVPRFVLSSEGGLGTGARVACLAPAIVLGVGLVALVGGLRV